MIYDITVAAGQSHPYRSPYSGSALSRPYDSLLQWPRNGYFPQCRSDGALLQEALVCYPDRAASTVADQVFGHQSRQQGISLRHLANMLYERMLIHQGRLKDIDRRLLQFHERLSIVKMHFPVDGGRSQQNLEKMIVELEKQRHDEELAFWKDSAEVRDKLFENAATYSATRHRKELLCGVEGTDGR